ncbi:MAG: L-ascorbate metabolism protein UlaG (beta-lactamase superfamily) [Bacteroidia bacterium]|jgi:L-ascorbate metabolism protein UlaG (beta-lactamase superfamily)
MFPQQSVQAAIDAQVKKAMPVHWAGFALSQHNWEEPAELFADAAREQGVDTVFPLIGELVPVKEANRTGRWWHKFKTNAQ